MYPLEGKPQRIQLTLKISLLKESISSADNSEAIYTWLWNILLYFGVCVHLTESGVLEIENVSKTLSKLFLSPKPTYQSCPWFNSSFSPLHTRKSSFTCQNAVMLKAQLSFLMVWLAQHFLWNIVKIVKLFKGII